MTIQDDINNFNANNTVEDLLSLSSLVYSNTENRSSFVATVDDLPDLNANTIAQGTVFYVESLGVPVVAQIGCWTGIDNRQLRNDFNLAFTYAWGCAACGVLGDNTIVSKSSPVSVVGGFTDWCEVSAGCLHSLGVRCNGTAWAWGFNTCGILGDNTIVSKSSPVSVVGGFTDWCQVSAGACHSLGVRQNGTAWAWGRGTCGVLGNNTTVDRSSPVSVVGNFTDWCQVSAGFEHSLGVRCNGTAWAWGQGLNGRLGDNTVVTKSSPVSVVGGFTNWCQVSAGSTHSLGVRQNGTAWAWGPAGSGVLGDNTVVSKSSPVSVVGGFTDWCWVSAGSTHNIGLRTNGTAWAWGANDFGRLGDNTTVSRSSPVSVVGNFVNWYQVSAGNGHSLGIISA
jgi:alpha-tubulin suppressor-like RCC1 family protein